ncbi:MAG TPA: HPF/RaiA family ribosome-associated protein, partial [Nitrospiria bacterium]|nr:HPF/RaiA family ribosome-associated protein [Nitrospiria bacterium]
MSNYTHDERSKAQVITMELPLQITVRNVSVSEAVMDDIRNKAVKLGHFSDNIIGCRVTVDGPHRHHHQGVLYNILIALAVRGAELVVKRQPNEDIYVAIRDAFDAVHQKLENYERRLRGEVKTHQTASHARVIKLFPKSGYGFLEAPEGHEIYFHENSVLNGAFNRMKIGTEVRFVEEPGEKGPQASTVVIVRKARARQAR